VCEITESVTIIMRSSAVFCVCFNKMAQQCTVHTKDYGHVHRVA